MHLSEECFYHMFTAATEIRLDGTHFEVYLKSSYLVAVINIITVGREVKE